MLGKFQHQPKREMDDTTWLVAFVTGSLSGLLIGAIVGVALGLGVGSLLANVLRALLG